MWPKSTVVNSVHSFISSRPAQLLTRFCSRRRHRPVVSPPCKQCVPLAVWFIDIRGAKERSWGGRRGLETFVRRWLRAKFAHYDSSSPERPERRIGNILRSEGEGHGGAIESDVTSNYLILRTGEHICFLGGSSQLLLIPNSGRFLSAARISGYPFRLAKDRRTGKQQSALFVRFNYSSSNLRA